jgi:hypothetical protein
MIMVKYTPLYMLAMVTLIVVIVLLTEKRKCNNCKHKTNCETFNKEGSQSNCENYGKNN